ncbi:MAG TPA: GNAT family N-acetyltransferase [Pyrinomonadaceae bacterium]
MSSDIQIKQLEIAEQDALLAFLRIAYPGDLRRSEPTFWRWHFVENPFAGHENIPCWILKRGEEVLGQIAAIPVEMKVGDERIRAACMIDLIVHEDLRGQGFGKRLFHAAGEQYSTMFSLGMNENSTPILHKLQWADLGSLHRYHRLLFPGEALKEARNIAPLREALNLAYAPFRPRLSRSSAKEFAVREVSSFDSSFTEFWQEARAQWPCVVERNRSYLEWQFGRQPGKRFEILGCYEENRLLGYTVLFFRKPERASVPPKAAISDICYRMKDSATIIDELLRAALSRALERRAGSLVTDVLDPLVEERLKRFGFWRVKTAPQFMAGSSEHQELLYNAGNWFLTRADSDVSIFEQPNL